MPRSFKERDVLGGGRVSLNPYGIRYRVLTIFLIKINKMTNQKYNGFASEEQYEAAFNAVKDAIVEFDSLDCFAVYGDPDNRTIDVQAGSGLNLTIDYDGSIQNIECDYPFNMFEVEMIQGLYECSNEILSVFDN